MVESKELVIKPISSEIKESYIMGVIRGVISYLKDSLKRIIPNNSVCIIPGEKMQSSIFRLIDVNDCEFIEKILSEMTDQEVLGSYTKKELLKIFHTDQQNTIASNFTQEVRNIIMRRVIVIKVNKNNELQEKIGSNQQKNTSNDMDNINSNQNSSISSLVTQAIHDIQMFGNDSTQLVVKCRDYLNKIGEFPDNTLVAKEYIIQVTVEALDSFFKTNISSTGSLLPIFEEQILDIVLDIERTHKLQCENLKRIIIGYVGFYLLSRLRLLKRITAKIYLLGIKYEVNTKDIRKLYTGIRKGPKNHSHPTNYRKGQK